MICKQCNNNVPNDSEYCSFCGNVLEKVIVEKNVVSDIERGYTYLELKEWKKAKEVFDYAIVNNDNKAKAYIGRLLAKLKLSDLECLSKLNKKLTEFDDFKMAVKYADDTYKQQLKNCYSLVEENIAKRKAKSKKCVIATSISCISIAVILVLSYFVFIPFGRFTYYKNLLSNGNIEKATKSFSNSNWFEYDEKAKELFYNKGVSLVEDKDYKNAEFCFNTTKGFNDAKKYLNYCKAQNLLANNYLESYDYFIKCEDFLDSKQILKTNQYFNMLDKLQGRWFWSGQDMKEIQLKKDEWRKSGKYYEVDGIFYLKERYDSYQQFSNELKASEAGSLTVNIAVDSTINSYEFTVKSPQTIIISGGNNLKISQGQITHESEGDIEFINNETINIGEREFTKIN